jgi:hypothetical protein
MTNLDGFIRNYYDVRGLVPKNGYTLGAPKDLIGLNNVVKILLPTARIIQIK